MSYEFLKTEFIGDVEYALLLDKDSGNVIRRLVLTNAVTSSPRIVGSPEFASTQIVKPTTIVPDMEAIRKEPEPSYAPANQPPVPGDLPRPANILPPHLRGVFNEHGSGAEAIERRTV